MGPEGCLTLSSGFSAEGVAQGQSTCLVYPKPSLGKECSSAMEHLSAIHSALSSPLSTRRNKYVFSSSAFLVPIHLVGAK